MEKLGVLGYTDIMDMYEYGCWYPWVQTKEREGKRRVTLKRTFAIRVTEKGERERGGTHYT